MSVLSIDDQIDMTVILVILLGLAITWAVYYGSDKAELPGESRIPDPSVPDDPGSDVKGRSFQ